MIREFFKKKNHLLQEKHRDVFDKYHISREFLFFNRKTVLRAIFIGMFIAFIPMPFQMLAIILISLLFHFNVPIGIFLVWITNPLTMPFIYYAEYQVGNFIIMNDGVLDVELSMEWFTDNFQNIFIPLYVGALSFSLLFSTLSYILVFYWWKHSVLESRRKN